MINFYADQCKEIRSKLQESLEKLLFSRKIELDYLLICLLANGHALINGNAGTGKTYLARLFAQSFNIVTKRIQMTVDLMPSDILGHELYTDFSFKPGPIFCNFLIAEEINFANPRTQASFFKVMEERSVSVGGITYNQLRPFMVCGIQTPSYEKNQDYPLTLNQLDRFLINLSLEYFDNDTSTDILLSDSRDNSQTNNTILSATDILNIQQILSSVKISSDIANTISRIVNGTHTSSYAFKYIEVGASLRSSMMLKQASQALALISGRDRVLLSDVHSLANVVLSHRILRNFKAEAEGVSSEEIINRILKDF